MRKKKTPKQILRSKVDRRWYEVCIKREPKCVICGKPAVQIHHFFPKGQHGYLRYNLDNGISLCMGCHFRIHHCDGSLAGEIIKKKGMDWYNDLKAIAQEEHASFNNMGWIQAQLDKLNEQ